MVWWWKITNLYTKVLSVIEKVPFVPFVPKLVKILMKVIEKVP